MTAKRLFISLTIAGIAMTGMAQQYLNIHHNGQVVSFNLNAIDSLTISETAEPSASEVIIKHNVDTSNDVATRFNACYLTPTLTEFMEKASWPEGTTFLLEGGKTYYLDSNLSVTKGFKLATVPEDLAQGKRARVIRIPNSEEAASGFAYSFFILGRTLAEGESNALLTMDCISFESIDFDCPLAMNYGMATASSTNATGTYFINTYSTSVDFNLNTLSLKNCTFQHTIRGFLREQGPATRTIDHLLVEFCDFYNCGYYNNSVGGYGWFALQMSNIHANILKDFVMRESTIYDSPMPGLFYGTSTNLVWEDDCRYQITLENNTFINFNTRGSLLFNLRSLPNGSVITCKNNLIVLTKNDSDDRTMAMGGVDVRMVGTKSDGTSGMVTLNFSNNWTTNNNLTNGSVFSTNAWNASRNSFGSLVTNGQATLNGELDVKVAPISATDLMVSPNPPYADAANMHSVDNLSGLYFKDFNNALVNNQVGASKWRTTMTK